MLSSHSISPVLDTCLGSWLAEAGRSGIMHKSPRHLWCTSTKPGRQREDCSNMITKGTTLKIDLQGVGQGWRQPAPDGALLCCSNIRKPWWSLKVEVQVEGIGLSKVASHGETPSSQEAGQVTAWTSCSSGPLVCCQKCRGHPEYRGAWRDAGHRDTRLRPGRAKGGRHGIRRAREEEPALMSADSCGLSGSSRLETQYISQWSSREKYLIRWIDREADG